MVSHVPSTIRFIEGLERTITSPRPRREDGKPFKAGEREIEEAGDTWMQLEIDRMRGK